MKKLRRFQALLISVLMVLVLVGCGETYPELTEEESVLIGEYAATTLLKYDANNRSRLVDVAVIEEHDRKEQAKQEQVATTPEQTPEGMKPVDDTPVIELGSGDNVANNVVSIDACMAAPEGIDIVYTGYRFCDTYPDNDSASTYMTLDASAGKKLLVVEFEVSNTTDSKIGVDFFSKSSAFNVNAGSEKAIKSMTTMLLDDMSTYVGVIEAGKSRKLVLLFEVDAAAEGTVSNIELFYTNEGTTQTIQL